MGVASDQPAVPFKPQTTPPGLLPSGIMGRGQDIRGMANKAKENVSSRQQRFMQMLAAPSGSATQAPPPGQLSQPAQPQQPMTVQSEYTAAQYIKAAQLYTAHRAEIDRFIHWVLFG
jgi:hypothetical protein